jgi:hypothetical protein
VSLARQLACAQRELALRERVYRSLVGRERMTLRQAEEEIACMWAIVQTLTRLVEEASGQQSLCGKEERG